MTTEKILEVLANRFATRKQEMQTWASLSEEAEKYNRHKKAQEYEVMSQISLAKMQEIASTYALITSKDVFDTMKELHKYANKVAKGEKIYEALKEVF